MLRDLIEHFSTLELTVANLPEDELGQGILGAPPELFEKGGMRGL